MNKKEIAIVVLLFALLVGWSFFYRPSRPPPAPVSGGETAGTNVAALPPGQVLSAAATGAVARAAGPIPGAAAAADAWAAIPEEIKELRSEDLVLRVSSRGGTVLSAQLTQYPATMAGDSGPVELDFSRGPALQLEGLTLTGIRAFTVAPDGRSADLVLTAAEGIELRRRIAIRDRYLCDVTDTFANPGDRPVTLSGHGVNVGLMANIETQVKTAPGMSFIGIDTLPGDGKEVVHWGGSLGKFLGAGSSGFGCSQPSARGLPEVGEHAIGAPVGWAAAKNKFFVQIVTPEGGASDCALRVYRDMSSSNVLHYAGVAASLRFGARELKAGESFERRMSYYAGPKKYDFLKSLDQHQRDVMQFGWWEWFRWICRLMLMTLNGIHGILPNYGVAVILLTVIVRLIFWPIMQKSTENMKKMQSVQPHVADIRKKFAKDPQRMNKEIMALYREHKVNPMAGCLPMLVQIPVFIALYTVLRSAIELRFAGFLWVADLSEPENLLAGVLPIPLNILPLAMTATTVIQQKLTPATGDPQQQKIMMWMPVIFLFMLYSMPSALVLYWTTSQLLSIVQLLVQRRQWTAKAG